MKLQDNRLIIVLGMAHSGTTVLVHTLLQCPKIVCLKSGTESWVFENKYLLPQFANTFEKEDNPVSEFVAAHPKKLIVLKRPWQETRPDFFKTYMPNAHYFILLRSFNALVKSWSKENSSVSIGLRKASAQQKKIHYDKHLEAANTFASKTGSKVQLIHYEEMCDNPSGTFAKIAAVLGIEFTFDTGDIGNLDKNVKEILRSKRFNKPKNPKC